MSKIDIIFLGTGDAFNTDGMANHSLLIRTDSLKLLVDAGPTCLIQMMELELLPEELDYIFITHFHGDHTAGFPFLMLYLKKKVKIPFLPVIFGPMGIKKCCLSLCKAAYRGLGLGKGLVYKEFKPRVKKDIFIDKDLSVDVCPVTHNPESIGYRFHIAGKIIAVSGDGALDDKLLYLVNHADIAIIECSTEKPVFPYHTSLGELAEYLPKINARRIVPVHTTKKIRKEIEQWGDEKILPVTDKKKVSL